MFRLIRVPLVLDKVFQPLKGHVHWDHFTSFCLVVVTIACMGGRRHVAHLYRHLEAPSHRTRLNHFFLVERWDPEAALQQKAQERLRALHLQPGETVSFVLDASKKANRRQHMEAVAKMKDPTTAAYIRGHQDVGAIVCGRGAVIPWGIRLSVKQAPCAALGVPCRKTTAFAAQLLQECKAPAGVNVLVLLDAYYRCHTVVKAGRAQRFHFASTLKSHRRLCKLGWRRKAGRYGRHVFRRRHTATLVSVKPHGQARSRDVDARWIEVSTLGPFHVVFSRKGQARKILGLVTDAPALSAAGLIQAYEKRWASEQCVKDAKQLLGLGHSQNRAYRAAVIHRPLVCVASALLTHLRVMRHGAQGQQTWENAADRAVGAAQEALRCLIWDDLVAYLKEKSHGVSVLAALARLRVA
jgi:DDE superfamily endonuclease